MPAKGRILVVGSTGQLGTEFVRLARAVDYPVRALVRSTSSSAHLRALGAEIAQGDLRDADSLERACEGVDAVVATATVVFPKGRYSFEADERIGYQKLVAACTKQKVGHLAFVSVSIPFEEQLMDVVPTVRTKHACEDLIRASGLNYTILRCAPFMDDYFALIGSALPLRGEVAATLSRSSGVTRLLRALSGKTIDRWGFATVPGPPTLRHSFVAVRDVAAYLLAALSNPAAQNVTLDIGGPEALSWADVCGIYARVLGRPVRVMSTPAGLYRVLSRSTKRLSQALSNQMGLLWILGSVEMQFDSAAVAQRFGVKQTSATDYLAEKAAC